MALSRTLVTAGLAWLSRLRFPTLFILSAIVFVVDLIVPDAIPIADELLLGLIAAGLASLRKERAGSEDGAAES